MIEIQFNYKEKKTKIKCNRVEHTTDVFKKFATEAKLDFENLLFFNESSKINLELDLIIEDQFNLIEKPKKKVKILVFEDISPEEFFAKFNYNTREELIKCSKNEKVSNIIEKFASKVNVKVNKILLLYQGNIITEDDLNKTYEQLASTVDKQAKIMNIVVSDYDNRDSVISRTSTLENPPIDNINSSNLSENLVVRNSINDRNSNDPIDLDTKKYYIKFLLILIVQYGLISLLVWIGCFLKINTIFIQSYNSMKWTFISTYFITIFSSFIYINFLKKFKKENFLYAFDVLYGLFITFNCFLLSKYIDSNNIVCTLVLILIGIISMELYSLIFNKYFKLYLFGLISFILSMISIVGAYFWIKNVITIIIIYSIGTCFILYLLFIIFISLKLCQRDEYIYASIIYNYSVFFGISIGFIKIYSYISNYLQDLKENYSEVYFYIRIFFFFIVQYIIIIFSICIGFSTDFNEIFISSTKAFLWTLIPSLLILLGMCAFLLGTLGEEGISKSFCIYPFLYILYIIIFSFLLSSFIEPTIILSLLFIHFLDLIAIVIYLLLFKSAHLFGIFFSPFIMSIITILLFHFNVLWIRTDKEVIYISIISFLNIIYLTVFSYTTKDICKDDEYNYGLTIFNFAIFCLLFTLALGLIALGLYLVFCLLRCLCICLCGEND